jgi:hypothetical protein
MYCPLYEIPLPFINFIVSDFVCASNTPGKSEHVTVNFNFSVFIKELIFLTLLLLSILFKIFG